MSPAAVLLLPPPLLLLLLPPLPLYWQTTPRTRQRNSRGQPARQEGKGSIDGATIERVVPTVELGVPERVSA